jgi:hypothetical protein
MKPSPLYSAAARVFFKNEIEQHLCEPVCGCHGKKKQKITKQTNKNALVEEEEDKLEIIHGRDVFHVLLRRVVATPTELLPMTLIHIYTSTVVVDIVSYVIENKKKGMLDALCAHSQKIHHQHLQVLLIYFNYHSIRDYSSIHVFSFCFFQFAPTLCGLFTIFYI